MGTINFSRPFTTKMSIGYASAKHHSF